MAEAIENGRVPARVEAPDGRLEVMGPDEERRAEDVLSAGQAFKKLLREAAAEPPDPFADSDDGRLPLPKVKSGEPPVEGAKVGRWDLSTSGWYIRAAHLPPTIRRLRTGRIS